MSPAACDLAKRFSGLLPVEVKDYDLYPEPDGSIGWECHRGKEFSLYLSFTPEKELAYIAVYRNDGEEEVHRGRGIKVLDWLPAVLQRFVDELV